jgi:hypothetical protein
MPIEWSDLAPRQTADSSTAYRSSSTPRSLAAAAQAVYEAWAATADIDALRTTVRTAMDTGS